MIHSSKPGDTSTFPLSPLAAISLALSVSSALAQQAPTADRQEPRQLSKLVAKDTEEEIKIDQVASPKFTQPLLDTPQTITVVSQQVLSQQGASTLIEALANTPGITMQLGENGNTSAGDTFSIRGSSSQSNVFLDGIRDLGAITRDVFNIQQVEIAKGAVGADYGRGATAGYINMVSKVAQADDFGAATLSADTGTSVRVTSDLNKQIGDNSALRFNAMWQDGDVVGRDYVQNNRWGVAPSLAFGLNTATRFYLYSQHVRADNVPDGGVPAIGLPGFYNNILFPGGIQPTSVDPENFYGRYDDYEKTKADMGTLRIEHDFSDTFKLKNSTRYGKSNIERVLTGINGLCFMPFPTPTTIPLSAAQSCPAGVNLNPNVWSVSRSRQSTVQENTVLTNQTNVTLSFNTGSIEHDLSGGIELIKEKQDAPAYSGLGILPYANLYNPNAYDNYQTFVVNGAYARAPTGGYSNGETKTYAGYAFDTLKFGEKWLVTAGVREERYETNFESLTGTPLAYTALNKSDNLTSWKVGTVFKPVAFGSIYVSYSNSLTPPGGDNFALSATTSNVNSPNFDPQEATNIEIGTKWDLLDARLALNAAFYRTETKNQLVILDTTTNEYAQYGKRRVQGAEFGAVGKITDSWSLIAGVAWSDNEQIEGTTTGTNASGAAARWAPDYSANLWSTYVVGKVTAGLGVNYVDDQKLVTDPSVNPALSNGLGSIPGYTVFNGMVGYSINDSLNFQLNVYNLLDKDYITSLNNGGSRVRIGAPRYARLTANFKF